MVLRFMKELCVGNGETGYCLASLGAEKGRHGSRRNLNQKKIKCFGAKSYLILENDFED